MIRILKQEEYSKAIQLSLSVYLNCGKADFNEEGLDTFKQFIYDEKRQNELIIYGAFVDDKLVGIIALRDECKHISLFFIQSECHRKGIGKSLFQSVVNDHPAIEFTVNSSTYAVPFYQSLGFVVTGEKHTQNGITSIPMNRVLDYKDCYSVTLYNTKEMKSTDLMELVFVRFPKIISYLLKLRDLLVKPFGLQTGGSFTDMIIKQNEYEIVLGTNDKHLIFHVLLLCLPLKEKKQKISIVTYVKYNNNLGKVYFFVISIFHKFIVKSLLKRAAKIWKREDPSQTILSK